MFLIWNVALTWTELSYRFIEIKLYDQENFVKNNKKTLNLKIRFVDSLSMYIILFHRLWNVSYFLRFLHVFKFETHKKEIYVILHVTILISINTLIRTLQPKVNQR